MERESCDWEDEQEIFKAICIIKNKAKHAWRVSKELESNCKSIQGGGVAENEDRNNHTDDIKDDVVKNKGWCNIINIDTGKVNIINIDTGKLDDVVRSLLLIRLGTAPLGSEVIYFRSWDSALAASYLFVSVLVLIGTSGPGYVGQKIALDTQSILEFTPSSRGWVGSPKPG